MRGLVDDTMLAALAVRGEPRAVARMVRDRFAGRADRVGFYLPYTIAPEVVAEVVEGFRHLDDEATSA